MKKTLLFVSLSFFTISGFGQDIFEAVRNKDVSSLKKIVNADPTAVNVTNPSGHSPLIIASYNRNVEAVKFLLDHGAEVNYDFSQGAAIHGASFKGYFDIVELLVDHGAKLDEPDGNGTTPLIYATLFGHTDVAKYLFEKGADPIHKDNTGNCAKDYAQSLNNQELLTLFNTTKG